MNAQDYFNMIVKQSRDKSFSESPQLTLGEFIEAIEDAGVKTYEGKDKWICFDFGSAIPTTLDSWRGSYAELALGYELSGYDGSGDYENPTAEKILNELKLSIGKTYTGWKGGEYVMDEDTPVWVANSGNADNTGVVGILDDSYRLIILTAYTEF